MNKKSNVYSNQSYDERFYTPRAQASSSRSTGSFETPRSSLHTGRSRGSCSTDSYYTPRSQIPHQSMPPPPNVIRRLPPQRPHLPPRRSSLEYQHVYIPDQSDIESLMNKHSSDKPSPGIQIQNQHVESIFSLARHSRVEEVDRLLVQGVDVNIRDENGNTILCIASQNGNKKMAKLALRWGCDINARNLKGNSPLHFCYQYGYRSLGEYLISKGANPNIKNVEGYTCFDLGGLGE